MALDKTSFVPLYYQLADRLRDQMTSNTLRVGEPIPSESELIRLYGISRGTVREALRILCREGLIERQKGVGTFVTSQKIEHDTGNVMSFSRIMLLSGRTPSAKVLEVREFSAPGFVCSKLRLSGDEKIVFIKRLRYGDDEALLIEHSYFRLDVGQKLMNEDMHRSLYKILQEKYGYRLSKSEHTIEASTAEEEDADLLGIEVGRPVLILSRLVFLANNAPVEYAMDIYRADRTKFKIQTMMSMEDEHARMDKFHQEYDTVLPNLPIGKVK